MENNFLLFSFNQFCSHGALFNIIITSSFFPLISTRIFSLQRNYFLSLSLSLFVHLYLSLSQCSLTELSPSEMNVGWLTMVTVSKWALTRGRSAWYWSHRSKSGDSLEPRVTVGCALQLGYGYKIGFNLLRFIVLVGYGSWFGCGFGCGFVFVAVARDGLYRLGLWFAVVERLWWSSCWFMVAGDRLVLGLWWVFVDFMVVSVGFVVVGSWFTVVIVVSFDCFGFIHDGSGGGWEGFGL